MSSEPVKFLGSGGVAIAGEAFGDPGNPPVLLLHGGGQTHHAWSATARTLADRGWYAVAIDLRGHGDSDWAPDGDYSLSAFTADVLAVASQLPSRPVLVGASLGGSSALAAVGSAIGADAIPGLVLVDIAPVVEERGVRRILDFMRTDVHAGFASLEDVAEAIHQYNPHRPRPRDLRGLEKNVRLREDGRWYWHWDPKFLGAGGQRGERTARRTKELERAARSLTVPVLLVRGHRSDVVSDAGVRNFLELAPHAQFVDVRGAGHMVAGDKNDAFNSAIVAFLEKIDGAGEPSLDGGPQVN